MREEEREAGKDIHGKMREYMELCLRRLDTICASEVYSSLAV